MQLPDALGGGWLDAGTVGTYYPSGDLSGPAAFDRREVRLDFAWDAGQKPGGSNDPKYAAVPADGWSAGYVGRVSPRFSETYTFSLSSSGRARLFYRVTGSSTWNTLIDRWTPHSASTDTATAALVAGTSYDLRVDYAKSAGAAVLSLGWSSASAPLQVVDPVRMVGQFLGGIPTADITKWSRAAFDPYNNVPLTADSNGWPTCNSFLYVLCETLGLGLSVDPLMVGTCHFSFTGAAASIAVSTGGAGVVTSSYDPATNTTSGSFPIVQGSNGARFLGFIGAFRDGPGGTVPGLTNLVVMRPATPGGSTPYPAGSTYVSQVRSAYGDYFTYVRWQTVYNQERDWSDRTPGNRFSQVGGGVATAPHYGNGAARNNGASWEWKVMLANEIGRDVLLSVPTVCTSDPADPTTYAYRLANLLRYGSDGVNPYTSPQAHPVYPPLNPNLRVYLEIENELWNTGNPFIFDWLNINSLVAADQAANNARWQAVSFDGVTDIGTTRYRHIAYRLAQIADCFRQAWGLGTALFDRVRPCLFWQYNQLPTIVPALGIEAFLRNADGTTHVATPRPINYYIYAGGGATYYSAANTDGVSGLLPDPTFTLPAGLAAGLNPLPAGADPSVSFAGTAGIAVPVAGSGAAIDANLVPPPYRGPQMAYIEGTGSITVTFTTPADQVSDQYGFCFRAHNRGADRQALRVFFGGVNQTAKTPSQGTAGVIAPAWTTGYSWLARNTPFANSNYYASKVLTLQPGTTYSITIQGTVAGAVAFVGEARIASLDAIFASDFPSGGQAAGQVAGSWGGINEFMADWARAFGLSPMCYEGGCSLGGDDGGSPLQQRAKYYDPRMATVQEASLDDIAQSWDRAPITLGTYAEWPDWGFPQAESGYVTGVGNYPIVQGVARALASLPPDGTNGFTIPATLPASAATVAASASAATGVLGAAGGYLAWPVVVDRPGSRTVAATTTGTGTVVLLFDDDEVARGTAGGTLAGTVSPYQGIHSIKVRREGTGTATVASVALAEPGAPAAPVVSSAVAPLSASFSWPAVAGATGYRFRLGTRPGRLSRQFDLGPATQFTPSDLVAGPTYYVAVHAYNGSGDSLPGAAAALALAGYARSVTLAAWDTAGIPANALTPPLPAALTTGGVTASALAVSPSVTAWSRVGNSWEYNSRNGVTLASTLAGAVAAGQYIQFAITPPAGYPVNLESIKFYPFWWHSSLYPSAGFGWAYQLGGGAWSAATAATGPLSASSSAPAAWTLDLSMIAGLQSLTQPAAFRFYFFGGGEGVGIGDSSGYDLAVSGSFVPVSTVVGRRRLRVPGLRPFT